MFEKHHEELLPRAIFLLRFTRAIVLGWIMIVAALGIGMAGYHYYEKMPWIDAFANASMILSGMGPLGPLNTYEGKLFAGCYALFSGLMFIVILGVIFGPIIHRFFHKFHLDDEDDDEANEENS